ncbi:MAG: hypothetical protein ACYTG0_43735 [Planctomycetota bacterium]|jgi:hypothetical protein
MELDPTQKVTSLISLANRAYDETKRYRDHVWKMLVWTIGLLVGVVAAAKASPDLATACHGKWLGSIFILLVAACGAWNIHFDYEKFVLNRNLLRECERRLQLYDEDVYGSGTVLPKAWKTTDYQFKECLPHYLQWMFVIAVVAAYSLYALITV